MRWSHIGRPLIQSHCAILLAVAAENILNEFNIHIVVIIYRMTRYESIQFARLFLFFSIDV